MRDMEEVAHLLERIATALEISNVIMKRIADAVETIAERQTSISQSVGTIESDATVTGVKIDRLG